MAYQTASPSMLAEYELELAAREAELNRREASVRRAEESRAEADERSAALDRRERELEQVLEAVEAQRVRLDEVVAEYESRRETLKLRTHEVEAARDRLRDEQARVVAASMRTRGDDGRRTAAEEGRGRRRLVVEAARNAARSGVAGSTLQSARGVSSAGRAPALQAGGRRFDPGTLHSRSKSGFGCAEAMTTSIGSSADGRAAVCRARACRSRRRKGADTAVSRSPRDCGSAVTEAAAASR